MCDARKYEGRSINKLQNGAIPLILKIGKIRNIRFVGNLILSISCEFYYDDVTMTSFINIKYGDVAVVRPAMNSVLLFVFCGQKDVMLMRFTLRCVQCMATSVLRDQQYTFGVGVGSLLVAEKTLLIKNDLAGM